MFLVSKSKLDHMFRVTYLEWIVTKFFDLTEIGGGWIFYINENIPWKPLQEQLRLPNSEFIAIEFFQNNQKWLLLGLCKASNQKTRDFI